MSEKLLPCPFCGGKGQIVDGLHEDRYVACRACGCEGPPELRAGCAISAWNRRAQPEVAQAERAVVDDETISRLLHLRSLVTAWALCQSAMDDLDKAGEVSDKASAEWNQWMSANRRAGDDLMAWCKADAERLVTSQVVAAIDRARKGGE